MHFVYIDSNYVTKAHQNDRCKYEKETLCHFNKQKSFYMYIPTNDQSFNEFELIRFFI